MKETWDARIQRAEQLASKNTAAQELLSFYATLLRAQKDIYEQLRGQRDWLPTGFLENDLAIVRALMPTLLRAVESVGPVALVEEARALAQTGDDEMDAMLLAQWRAPSDTQFFAKALLQPYARWLAESGARPVDRIFEPHESRCPFCGGMPQVSFLQSKEASSESGNRDLLCATCLTVWPFRRVVCAYCCEERPLRLGYFHTPEFEHIRVEACDTCHRYIKGVDLTRKGLAVPLVDEVASAPLDLWAREHGYTKIELNLVGL
jgi:FdhE protein